MQNVKSKSNRSLSWLLVLSMILSLCAMPAGAALADGKPDLEIGTLAELQAFARAVDEGNSYQGQTVVLTADIDASSAEKWNSIGETADNKSFRGTFDGQGHTVTFAIKSATGYNGLFCYNFGTIKNVKIAGSIETTEKAATYNGAVCALNKSGGIVDSCINEASCTYSANYSSGIAGQNAGTVTNCINRGSISGAFMMSGAITCGGTITNCLNVGQLDGKATNLSYAGKLDNSYFLDTTTSKNQTRTFGTAKTEAELKDPAFAATLGEAFAANPNGGFPVLAWELTGSTEKPHEHSFGAWAADDDKTHSRSCDCGEKQTEPHRWADGKCTDCGAKDPTTAVIPVCNVRVTLGFANASFKVPSGTELKITWKFVNDENDVPKGWQMLVNGMEPVVGGYSYAVPENEAGITGTIPSGMAMFTTGKPDSLSVKPTDADCGSGLKKELGYTQLTKEQLKFELKFVDIVTKEEIGTYGDGYTASQKYGEFTISATGNPVIANYVTANFNGYRIYMGTYGNVDKQIKTVHVGAEGVIEKSVTMYVEINHSTISDKHVQPVKFVNGDETVLETTVPLKNAYVNSYTPIELDMTKAAAELKELGYELDMTKTYTVTCNNFTHDPDVSIVEVTKIAPAIPYEYTIADGKVTITKYLGSEVKVNVPSEIEGKSVIAIGANAFAENKTLTEVALPASVISIGQSAFAMCTNLESINAEKVMSFGAYAFFQCSSLKAFTFNDNIETLPIYMFSECTSLASVKLPSKLKALSNHLFDACESLKSVNIPGGVTVIERSAFENAGIETIVIPDSVVEIGDYAFENAPLTSVSFGKNVEKLGSLVFWGCNKLTEIVIPGKVTVIPYGTFFKCSELAKVVIGRNVTVIDETAFKEADNAVIYGYADSAAFSFAAKNGIKFVCIEHVYTAVVTAPTCTERGYTTHTCACGESYVDSYVDALGHKYNSVGVCTACGAKDPEYKNVFSDVGDYYATDAIIWASYNKITYGVAEGLFAPDEFCTRAQIISMLYRAAGEPKVGSAENPFTDVHEGDYFYNAVLWAVEKGITYGTSADKFSPHDNCTRAEIVSFLYRAAGEPKVTANASFTDVGADAFYANAVAWAVENGITYGTSTDKFSPYDTCTRAQAVTFLYRCCVK